MLWRRPAVKAIELARIVQVNDRILLEVKGRQYLSRVEDLRHERLVVAAPLEKGVLRPVGVGEKVNIGILSETGLRRFQALVSASHSDQIPTLELTDLQDLGVVQRRQRDRVSEKLMVRYRPQTLAGDQEPWRRAATVDFSASGMQLEIPIADKLDLRNVIQVEVTLPLEDPLVLTGRVVRSLPAESCPAGMRRVGVHFEKIGAAEQDVISRYIFRKQSEARDIRRKYARLWLSKPLVSKFRPVGGSEGDWRSCCVFDMAMGGMRLATEHLDGIDAGQKIEIAMSLPTGHKLTVRCQVVNTTNLDLLETLPDHQVGVKFVGLGSRDRDAIQEFLFEVDEDKYGGWRQAA